MSAPPPNPAMEPEQQALPLHKRFLNSLKSNLLKTETASTPSWKAFNPDNVALHLSQDFQPENNATHRKLPEEHIAAYRQSTLPPSPDQQPQQPPRQLRGPVPRRSNTRAALETTNDDRMEHFKNEMALHFLSSHERDILHTLRKCRKTSFFRPLLDHKNPVLLVNENDLPTFHDLQSLLMTLPGEAERHQICRSLQPFLSTEQMTLLRRLMFNENVQIRVNTQGTGVESPEQVKRPESGEFFGYVMDLHYNKDPKDLRYENEGWKGKGKGKIEDDEEGFGEASPLSGRIKKTMDFQVTYSSRPSIEGTLSSSDSLPASHRGDFQGLYGRQAQGPSCMRGGGGDDDQSSQRTTMGVLGDLFCKREVRRLEDDERVPKALYWLAGGNTRTGTKQPTGKELKVRKKAEKENREAVGFVGTLMGKRVTKKKEDGEGGRGGDDVYMSGGLGPSETPAPLSKAQEQCPEDGKNSEAEISCISPADPKVEELLKKPENYKALSESKAKSKAKSSGSKKGAANPADHERKSLSAGEKVSNWLSGVPEPRDTPGSKSQKSSSAKGDEAGEKKRAEGGSSKSRKTVSEDCERAIDEQPEKKTSCEKAEKAAENKSAKKSSSKAKSSKSSSAKGENAAESKAAEKKPSAKGEDTRSAKKSSSKPKSNEDSSAKGEGAAEPNGAKEISSKTKSKEGSSAKRAKADDGK